MLSPHLRPALLVLAIALGLFFQLAQPGAHPRDSMDYSSSSSNLHRLHISL